MKILFKSLICIFALIMCAISVVSCGEDPIADNLKMTKEKAIKVISKVALDYTGLELDEIDTSDEVSVKKIALFLDMDQDDFTKLMKPSKLDENEVLSDSRHFFDLSASSAYLALKNCKDFEFGKVYDVNFVNSDGETLENTDCPPVSIVDAKDGGLYILYYSDSELNDETVQIAFYLNVHGDTSVLKSMAIYAGESEDEKGIIITDYSQFISDKTIETASIRFEFDDVATARDASKILNRKSKTMKEIKENAKTFDYTYAAYVDSTWESNSVSVVKEDTWDDFMKDLYSAMTNHIDLYGADYESLFDDENLIDVDIEEKTPESPSTDTTEPEETTPPESTEAVTEETTQPSVS